MEWGHLADRKFWSFETYKLWFPRAKTALEPPEAAENFGFWDSKIMNQAPLGFLKLPIWGKPAKNMDQRVLFFQNYRLVDKLLNVQQNKGFNENSSVFFCFSNLSHSSFYSEKTDSFICSFLSQKVWILQKYLKTLNFQTIIRLHVLILTLGFESFYPLQNIFVSEKSPDSPSDCQLCEPVVLCWRKWWVGLAELGRLHGIWK